MVEHQLPKLRVVGSIPIYRSTPPGRGRFFFSPRLRGYFIFPTYIDDIIARRHVITPGIGWNFTNMDKSPNDTKTNPVTRFS